MGAVPLGGEEKEEEGAIETALALKGGPKGPQ